MCRRVRCRSMGEAAQPLLLSVALDVPPQPSSDFFGHEVVYQHALVQAAQRQGIDAAIAVPFDSWSDHPDVVCLLGPEGVSWVDGLRQELQRLEHRDCMVLFYEGSLELLRTVVGLAEHHPNVCFVLNFFRRDAELAWPCLSERRFKRGRHLGRGYDRTQVPRDLPLTAARHPNLVLYADTDRRRLLAEALGFEGVATWPLYSVVVPRRVASTTRDDLRTPDTLRVVIPVAGRQVTRQLVYEIGIVIRLVARYTSNDTHFEWLVFGGGYVGGRGPRSRRRLLQRLRRLGVRFEPSGFDGDRYRRTMQAADVIWLPKRGLYTTQSSGKAADALICGAPVLAPNGSFPAMEMQRWVPGAPAYTGAREAAEIFLRAANLFPVLRAALHARASEIAWWYSPDRTVTDLVEAGAKVRRRPRLDRAEISPSGTDECPVLPPEGALTGAPGSLLMRVRRYATEQLAADLHELWVRIRTVLQLR